MTTVVLLAAGQSRRFGPSCKLQTMFRGKPLLRHAADAIIATDIPALAVVTDSAVAKLLPEFQIVQGGRTQSESLKSGLAHVTNWPALIVLGDMPFVDPDLLVRIAAAPCPATATDGTTICPPASVPQSLLPAIMALTGDQGAGTVLRGFPGLHRVRADKEMLKDFDLEIDFTSDQKVERIQP